MKIKVLFLFFIGLCLGIPGFTQPNSDFMPRSEIHLEIIENKDTSRLSSPKNEDKSSRESKRFVAAVLCLTLGPFGMHRLYLGSTPQVAAAYSVTLGAIGIVPVVDFLLISFSKDISRFKNNGKVIMWGK